MAVSECQLTADAVRRWSPLRFAEETGAWTWVEKFLRSGVSQRHLESTRRMLRNADTAAGILRAACECSLLQLLQFVISVDASLVNIELDEEGTTPLHVAAENKRIAVARVLVSAGADVCRKTRRGRSPLHAAAVAGSDEMAGILLYCGARARELDGDGKSAVQLALQAGHVGLSRWVDMYDSGVEVSLWRTAIAGLSGDVETVRTLLPLVRPREPGEWTHLHWATLRGSATVIRTLLAAGMDPNASDRHGNTPLHVAAARRPPELSAAFIDAGADIDAADATGSTALHYAVRTGNVATARLLLESGARHDIRDSDGDTPLHRAVSRGSLEAVEALLEAGADRRAADARGETPYDLARRFGYTDILRVLQLTQPAEKRPDTSPHS